MDECTICGVEWQAHCRDCGGAERSEAPPPLDTTKDKWYSPGAALSSACPRAGSILLESRAQKRVIVNTTCNSWRCTSCRDRNRTRFKAVVSSGISNMTGSAFITITYKADVERLNTVGCVARDWRALWRLLKKEDGWLASLPKMRVMELTKRRMPHFHLVIGNLPSNRQVRCFGRSFDVTKYLERFDHCPCVAHVVARAWKRVQGGESWLVHAVPVGSPRGAAAYLAKYLEKEFDGERAQALGMTRRWSTSRNWPSEARARLSTGVQDGGWRRAAWAPHTVNVDELKMDEELLERKETPRQIATRLRSAKVRFISKAKEAICRPE